MIRQRQIALGILACIALSVPTFAAAMDSADLIKLVKEGHIKNLQLTILESDDINRIRDDYGQSLLHMAVENNHADVTVWLLQNHADVNAVDQRGCTPLYYAIDNRNMEIIKILSHNQANVISIDGNGASALHWAAAKGTAEMVNLFVDWNLAVDGSDSSKDTPLMYAAQNANLETTKALLAHGASLDAKNNSGETALYKAADPYWAYDNEAAHEVVAALLDAGADPNLASTWGELPQVRAKTWSTYWMLASRTPSFSIRIGISVVCATIFALILLLIWRSVAKNNPSKPAAA